MYDAATGYVTMKVSHFSPFTAVFARDYWTDHAADGYATPVDTANKVVTVASAEELALFAKEVTDDGKNYSGYTLNLATMWIWVSTCGSPLTAISGFPVLS